MKQPHRNTAIDGMPFWSRSGIAGAIWLGFASALAVAPWLFDSSLALTMLTQIGYLVVICLSYNILLGQGGMLSFGHVVYVGMGAFATVHVLNRVGDGAFWWPVSLLPLVGGLAAALVAAVLGFMSVRRGGTTFAMITLGLGELVAAVALMLPGVFGGEGGIATDRVVGEPVLGISFGPPIELYYLVALWCLVCTALMFAFTRTPLGRMLNAVRDNPQRVAFVGYDPQRVRYRALVISAFFAGIGGALMALHLEMVTASDSFSHERSAAYLLFTFVGGVGAFVGPIIGAVLMVLTTIGLSQFTLAWKLYLGLLFMLMVMFAPSGVVGILRWHGLVVRQRCVGSMAMPYLGLWLAAAGAVTATAVLVEMLYHLQLGCITGHELHFLGLVLDVASPRDWTLAVLAALTGLGLLVAAQRRARQRWQRIESGDAHEA